MRLLSPSASSAIASAIALSCALASSASAASFAAQVVDYVPGNAVGIYANPSAALGAPSGVTGENAAAAPNFGPGVLSPFNAAYQNDELVRVGEGGSITLRLERFVLVGAGVEFGVIENVVLFDPAFPSGTTTNPAATFSEDRALVEVSADGAAFVGLTGGAASDVLFNIPANYYLNAGAFDAAAPSSPQLADFGKPFTAGLSAFDGKSSYADVLAALDGSAGGTWLDASTSGLAQIGYVRFSVADDGNAATTLTLELDSVLTNGAQLGALTPEPASLAAIAVAATVLGRRRRRV